MILITGATGLLGGHLTASLLLQGKKIRAIYRDKKKIVNCKEIISFYSPEVEKYFDQIEWVEADVRDTFSLEEALENITEVYHCAGMVSFDGADRKLLYQINAEGTANLVNACLKKGIKKLCHVSSVATLQVQAHKTYIDELSIWKTSSGNSSYGISKYRGEFEAWRGAAEGLDVVVVNPSFIIGPGCKGQSSSALIEQCREGLHFYTEGITGYVDVRDVVQCMIQLMEHNKFGQRYILTAENLSFKEVTSELHGLFHKNVFTIKSGSFMLYIAMIGDWLKNTLTGKKRMITPSVIKSALSKNYYDNSKVVGELNHRFIPVKESLAYTAEFYK